MVVADYSYTSGGCRRYTGRSFHVSVAQEKTGKARVHIKTVRIMFYYVICIAKYCQIKLLRYMLTLV